MELKKIVKALLYPPMALMIVLLPISSVFLVCSMVFIGTESVTAILSYVVAAYTLTVWCVRMPEIIRFFKRFKEENRYVRLWRSDERLRVRISLYSALAINTAYAAMQLGLGLFHRSLWYYTFAAYYLTLAIMRLFLLRHTKRHAPGEKMRVELVKYRACAVVFLLLNLALSMIVFFMIYWGRTFRHSEITTIVMAAYTFTAFSLAIVNIVKYRKYNSPIYSAAKAIGLTAACVSILTLESTMLTTFSAGDEVFRRVMLGSTGGVVAAFIITMAVYMIVESTKKIRMLKVKEHTGAE
ncbi:MAG: hypothetical protein IJX38_06320 [Clostridia bacterium]|nr:hypothetical protein [Clostridia bacterium]